MIATLGRFSIDIDHKGHCHVEAFPGSGFDTPSVEERMNFNALLQTTAKDLEEKLNNDREDLGVTASIAKLMEMNDKTLKRKGET